ncbi:MAG: hypothetical protein P8182_07095 [Deltaproteobacteria bacterium]
MEEEEKQPTKLVWVKDKAGNEYLCPVDALKDPENVTEEELKHCVDAVNQVLGSDD